MYSIIITVIAHYSIIQKWEVGTVDLNIPIYYIPPFFELLVGLKENEKKIKPS